uniref:(northern house mosquito) hypothetical protein n=1 Tax=Culex pipiens TaxID=7175 RepID=A0A8D8CZ83_CULPI
MFSLKDVAGVLLSAKITSNKEAEIARPSGTDTLCKRRRLPVRPSPSSSCPARSYMFLGVACKACCETCLRWSGIPRFGSCPSTETAQPIARSTKSSCWSRWLIRCGFQGYSSGRR